MNILHHPSPNNPPSIREMDKKYLKELLKEVMVEACEKCPLSPMQSKTRRGGRE